MKPTLDPSIAEPTAQQVFDAVVVHLGAQREVCRRITPGETGGCAYRNTEYTKACGVGALFTDDECDALDRVGKMNSGVGTLFRDGLIPERLASHRILLHDLQAIHDQWDVGSWPAELRNLGSNLDLAINEIDGAFA